MTAAAPARAAPLPRHRSANAGRQPSPVAPASNRPLLVGYAAYFDRRDGAGDIIRPGAFRRSLSRRPASAIAMLWQHDPSRPIGRWISLHEDRIGLRVTGVLAPGVALAAEAQALIRAGALSGLSIGFRAVRAERGRRGSQRLLTEIDLWEISLVTFPQVETARVRLLC